MREGVWTYGENTELEAWVGGQTRKIAVTRGAIEEYLGLGPEKGAGMSADARCKFVTDHLGTVIAAAKRKMEPTDHASDLVTVRRGEL